MYSITAEAKASYAFIERNFNLVRRYIAWEMVFLVYTIVNTLTIGFIGVSSKDPELVLYLVVGALLWGFLSILFHEVSESIAWERWEGTIEYTFMAPIYRFTHLAGQCSFAAIYGVIRTVVILIAVALFFDVKMENANLFAASVILIVSSVSFMGLGLIGAVLPLLSPERGAQATHIIQALILLVSGVYYEISVLPAWLQPVSKISPATYTLAAMRKAILHDAGLGDLWHEILLLLVTGLILVPAGLLIFSMGERWGKRKGKLTRSG